MEIEDDWQWILASYCITNEGHDDGDFEHIGRGCNPGGQHVHVHYNADFSNDKVIEFGDGMDISHIKDLEERVQKAVDWTQEGVDEFIKKQEHHLKHGQQYVETTA